MIYPNLSSKYNLRLALIWKATGNVDDCLWLWAKITSSGPSACTRCMLWRRRRRRRPTPVAGIRGCITCSINAKRFANQTKSKRTAHHRSTALLRPITHRGTYTSLYLLVQNCTVFTHNAFQSILVSALPIESLFHLIR